MLGVGATVLQCDSAIVVLVGVGVRDGVAGGASTTVVADGAHAAERCSTTAQHR